MRFDDGLGVLVWRESRGKMELNFLVDYGYCLCFDS